jgi:hypothetical protein
MRSLAMVRSRTAGLGWAGCLVLLLGAAGCKKDNSPAVETASTGATSAVQVTDVKLGRSLGTDRRVSSETDKFRPGDVIYAVVETRGTNPNTALQARWTYEDGQVVDESSRNISASGEDATEFHISKPSGWPKGKYSVQVTLNGTAAGTKNFEVR